MEASGALKVVRPFLAGLAAAGLAAGVIARLVGPDDWANVIWASATVPALLVLLVEIVTGLRHGDVGLDIIAALSMTAALAFGEMLAAAISGTDVRRRPIP